jgi:aryl-alcohol dehydrogenase-like predicted oxidoreductase
MSMPSSTSDPVPASDPDRPGGVITIGGDMPVGRLGFGAMRLTGPSIWGEPRDPAEARRVLGRVVELGLNFIDTAEAYGPEINERLIAETLHPYPAGLVIATKGGLSRPGPDRWDRDARPERLRASCEGSLRRLRLERIDLYQLHAPDPRVPFEDSVAALADLRAEGKIRHIGLSNVSTDQLRLALRRVAIVSVQNRYSLFDRSSDDVLVECERAGIAFLPWRPIADASHPAEDAHREALDHIARRRRATPIQIAIAWLLACSPMMIPIPGTSSVAHLEENVAAARIELSPDELSDLT